MYLENIKKSSDIKKLDESQLKVLAKEIRQVILDTVMGNGGHLASSLGAVEIIIAMHYCFDAPKDKFIFDVGHQCYAHKLLTGRGDIFSTLRKMNGMSGFPKRCESEYDVANTGHSSTSLSIACGLSRAFLNEGNDAIAVSLIGDGALTGGLAFEALNDAISVNKKQIIILNDNSMSISENVGSTAKYLLKLHDSNIYKRFKRHAYSVIKGFNVDNAKHTMKFLYRAKNSVKYFLQGGMPFEQFGLRYYGPIDGHNLSQLINVLNVAKKDDESSIIHVVTKKGYGFKEAEEDPANYHGYSPKKSKGVSFSKQLGLSMKKIASMSSRVYAVTAAMREGTGLECYAEMFPNRFADVGIAEAHATTMCAGLAIEGYKPYFAVYSSFLQRAYDSVIHDVCLQDLPVTFCIDRAGIVPDDGETHQGIYDVGFLRLIPNMVVMSPKDNIELDNMLKWSLSYNHPLAIRYPKGIYKDMENHTPIELGVWEVLREHNSDIVLLATGASMVNMALNVYEDLKGIGIEASIVNARFIKPLDEKYLDSVENKLVITLEDNLIAGGFGSSVLEHLNKKAINASVLIKGIDSNELTCGTVSELQNLVGLSREKLFDNIVERYNQYKKANR